jgi:hypothetical protein
LNDTAAVTRIGAKMKQYVAAAVAHSACQGVSRRFARGRIAARTDASEAETAGPDAEKAEPETAAPATPGRAVASNRAPAPLTG